MIKDSQWMVYILKCSDQTLYTGITTDLERRLAEHNGDRAGGAKYTAARRPVTVFYAELAESRSQAAQRESQLKRLPRAKKLVLSSGNKDVSLFVK